MVPQVAKGGSLQGEVEQADASRNYFFLKLRADHADRLDDRIGTLDFNITIRS